VSWLAAILMVLPFLAVPMVFLFGVVRTAAICGALLLLYTVAPFIYFAVRSLQYADASIVSTWQYMMQVDVLTPLVTIAAVSALWVMLGVTAGVVSRIAWLRWRRASL